MDNIWTIVLKTANEYTNMVIQRININECFNVIDSPSCVDRFNVEMPPARDVHVFEQITYRCHICDYFITFKDNDFRKHRKSDFNNLKKCDADYFIKYQSEHCIIESFLDFYCPKCGTATRIYYTDGIGGKYDYLVTIKNGLILVRNTSNMNNG